MGVIKDGTISGYLPSAETFAVHFPGYPSSLSRAVETLGGSEGIVKARSSSSNQLELRFRPEDPYCHPTFGELRCCENTFLLKISKGSKKSPDSLTTKVQADESNLGTRQLGNQSATAASTSEEEDQTHLCADIVARVPEAYHFEGMVDYQHVVSVHAENSRRKKRSWTEVEERQFEKSGFMDMDNEDVMLLVPPLFSNKDVPTTLALSRPPVPSNLKMKPDGTIEDSFQVFTEKSVALDFRIKEIPKKVNWEERLPQGSNEWERHKAISKLFDERPIWPKKALIERLLDLGLDYPELVLKRFLINIAYYFNNGPFPKFWIIKGYDPREDPDSRIYQGIDFRVPQQLQSFDNRVATNELKQRWEDICAFRVFPHKFNVILQLYELADEYIQHEIRNSPPQQTCTLKSGWFTDHMLDSFRQRALIRFLSIYPRPGVEGLLKQASERFEKSKRMRFLDSSSKLEKQKDQQPTEDNEGRNENAEKNDVEDTDDGDEEEEIEDNDEEEVDAFDAVDPCSQAFEEGDNSLEPYYPDMENISRTYLQDLFGSFPSAEGRADEVQNEDGSDGEYQIYEQDSEDNYSDDYED
ncbi:general transcription factor 3C polypeptide 5-like isoform X2 [Punica granatum]|uniref:General transcription factor 3C polypeptide 5-like isoform X2 n=1 Tax=Punica granatum TaxID=22663 RepID=A0A6P8CQ81_PUNGR|nr:general transcription factor 3C polypeptide 5-like isoform X2 [Punica granatum]